MKKILIIGAGGQALNVLDILLNEQNEFIPFGLVDVKKKKAKIFGIPVIGTDKDLSKLKKKYKIDYAFPAIGYGKNTDNALRKKIFFKIKKLKFQIPNIISNNAIIRFGVKMGIGNLIQPGAVLDTNSVISNNTSIGANTVIGHKSILKDHTTISGGAIIKGDLVVGEGTFVGMNSSINNHVGKWCKIGPCTTNFKKLPNKSILITKENYLIKK